jgi:hypothetical protein
MSSTQRPFPISLGPNKGNHAYVLSGDMINQLVRLIGIQEGARLSVQVTMITYDVSHPVHSIPAATYTIQCGILNHPGLKAPRHFRRHDPLAAFVTIARPCVFPWLLGSPQINIYHRENG